MVNKICGIYKIENKVNGKVYIGLSSDILKRFKEHKSALSSNRHINKHLLSAYHNYGIDNFSFDIIEECESTDKELLKELEIKNIKKYKANNNRFGYNLTSGGDGVRDLNEISKASFSNKRSMRVLQLTKDGEVINKFKNCKIASESLGILSYENIRSCCNKYHGCKTILGYVWMYEKDYKIEGFNKNYYKKDIKTKPIIQYDLEMNYICEYESARECERQTGIGYKLISRVCNGGRPYTHGYIFKFK